MDNTTFFVLGVAILIVLGVVYSRLNKSSSKTKSTNPLGEAEVYIAYGRNKQAIDILEKHLLTNPGDETAISLLAKAKG